MECENNKPLLTIGIPTYNRANYLDKCLGWIYDEIGDDPDIEILVCDNCSTDNTEEIVKKYKEKHNALVYFKQEKNLGFPRNFKKVLELANGEFINPHGDDDFFSRGIVYGIINLIKENKDISLMYLPWRGYGFNVVYGNGFNDYLNQLNGIVFITSMVINSRDYKAIENKDKYIDCEVGQVYIQMELLKNNPKFYVASGSILALGSGHAPRIGYNLMNVLGEYLDIMYTYVQHGLEKQTIKNEKLKIVNDIIIPSLNALIRKEIWVGIENFEEIFTKHYWEEDYYLEKLNEINRLLKLIN